MPDWIAPVEAAYEFEGDLERWLLRVADATQSLLRADVPPIASLCVWNEGAIKQIASACRDPARIERQQRLLASRSPEANARTWVVESNLHTMSERVFSQLPGDGLRYQQILGADLSDVVFLAAPAGTGFNVIVSAAVPGPRKLSAIERVRGSRVAAHLGAGFRLRLALERASGGDLPADAVLDVGGRMHDASRAASTNRAREWLRDAVRCRELARTQKQRSDPDTALDIWRGLVAGRWSLVDRFESDGKRFVVAHPNAPDVGDPRGLTFRERQVAEYLGMGRSLKEIAYWLGITSSAVSNATRRAAAKLGLSGRVELAHLFAPLGLRARLAEVEVAGERLAAGATPLLDENQLARLSRAERDVALDLLRGATIAAISQRRGSSPLTIEAQVKAVYAKLAVGSRVELAAQLARTAPA